MQEKQEKRCGRRPLKIEQVKNLRVLPQNRTLIEKYISHQKASGTIGESRAMKLRCSLTKMASWLGVPFEKAKQTDLEKLIDTIDHKGYADWTAYGSKVVLKAFYRWMNDGETPKVIKWLKPKIKNGKRLPEELLTEEEVMRLVDKAKHPRDKAMIMVLYESGVRIGELLSLQLKHVAFDDNGAVLRVTGKTGDRRIRIVASVPLLATWIDNHPSKDKPDSPLWTTYGKSSYNESVTYPVVAKTLRHIAALAGITKRVNPHSFRHARASFLAKHLTEYQLKQYMGWTMGSDMAQVYVHLSGRDVDNSILALNGKKIEKSETESKIKPRTCYRCKLSNSATSSFCTKCGAVLDLGLAQDVMSTRQVSKAIPPDADDYDSRLAGLAAEIRMLQKARGL